MTTSHSHRRGWFADALAAAAFAVFLAVVFRRSIFQGQVLVGRDLTAVHHPWRWFVAQALHDGRLPLWNPFNFMGEAALANPQTACFYWGNWLFIWWGFASALTAFVLVHLFAAAIGTFVFCRRLGCGPSAAALAGAAFGFGGWMLTRAESPPELASCALMPWVVWTVYEATLRGRVGWAVASGLLLAAQLFSGNLNATYNSCLAVGICWATVFAATYARSTGRERLVRVLVGLTALGTALGLFAAQSLPTAELVGESARAAPLSQAQAAQWAVLPKHWMRLVAPFMFGMPGYDRHWGGLVAEFAHGAFYVGVLGLVFSGFACASIIDRERAAAQRLAAGAAAASAVFFAVAAMGDATPLYRALRAGLPGFNRFHSPYKLMFLVSFSLSLLSGLGWDALSARPQRSMRGRAAACWAVGLVGLVMAVAFWLNAAHVQDRLVAWMKSDLCVYPFQLRALRVHVSSLRGWVSFGGVVLIVASGLVGLASRRRVRVRLVGALCVAAALAELGVYGSRLFFEAGPGVYSAREAPGQAWQGRVYVPDHTNKLNWLLYGQRCTAPFEWARAAGICNRNLPRRVYAASGENALATRRHRSWRFAVEADVQFGRVTDSLLRAACVSQVVTEANLGLLPPLRIDGAPEKYVSVRAVANPLPRVRLSASDAGRAELARGDVVPERVWIKTDVARKALVELADSYYPGWRAWVDGRRAQVELAAQLFRAVQVPAGRHSVTMAFEPRSLKLGSIAAMFTAAVLAFACTFAAVRPSRRPASK